MKVSVIIPIYNAAAYLERCILSILNQTLQDVELIAVNDGSTDYSLEVLQKLLADIDHCKIINQSNQGVSCARNTGIVHATGTYLAFVDSDDYIAPNYLETLIEATHKGEMDWILSGTSYIKKKEEIRVVSMEEDIWEQKDLTNKFSYIDYTTSIHGKLYKKEIIDKHHLQFDTVMSFAEDRDFNIEYIRYIKKVHNIPYIGYTYCTDIPNSLSKKNYYYKFRNDCIYWNKVLSLSNNNHSFKVFVANRFYYAIVDNICLMTKWLGIKQTQQITKNNYKEKDKLFLASYKQYIKAPKWQKEIVINNPYLYSILLYLNQIVNS